MNVPDTTKSLADDRVMAGDKLSGRVALVTGGTRGIGAAICRSMASQGAAIAAGYSGNTERADQFLKAFDDDYDGRVRATVHQGNISRPEDCRRVVQEVLDQHGRLDILVNNAGITIDKMAMKMSVEAFLRLAFGDVACDAEQAQQGAVSGNPWRFAGRTAAGG